jgi:hypothetical protein
MITPQEIENFARQMADPDFVVSEATIGPLIGHLPTADYRAVLKRAEEIARAASKAMAAEADALENVERLAHAAGMPDGGNPVAWLQERGLIEEINGALWFKPAKPGGA